MQKKKTIPIEKLEKAFGIKIQRNSQALGLDTATKTGYAIITTKEKTAWISAGFIQICAQERYAKYDEFIRQFYELIDKDKKMVIVEDTYLNKRFGNVWMFKMITFIGAIAYTVARIKGCRAKLVLASNARKKLGLKGTAKKAELIKRVNEVLDINLTDDNEIDAIILAVNGIIEK